jgi:4-hydroxy-tetrahydrodipicolinate reductase
VIRVIIIGASGYMGRAVATAVENNSNDFTVVAGVSPSGRGSFAFPVYKSISEVTEPADAIIDFSRPKAIYDCLPYCKEKKIPYIIGTTGLSEDDMRFIDSYANSVPIFISGNMSLGVNLQLQLVKSAAAALGVAFEPEIVEKHHHFKVDAPSGTALMLADAISSKSPEGKKYTFGRYTKTERRKQNELGIHSVRGGTIVGEHEVYFIGTDEIVEISHRAYSKQIFALGALRATKFMMSMQPGLYSMQDIVLENEVLSNLYVTDGQALIEISSLNDTKNGICDVFTALADASIFVDMISQAGLGRVSLTVRSKQLYDALSALNSLKATHKNMKVVEYDDITKLTVEGVGMETRHGIAAQVFEVLSASGIEPLIVTTSETKIQVGINSEFVSIAVNAIAERLDL